MPFIDIHLTKKKALALYKGKNDRDRCIALANDLGVHPQVVLNWGAHVPRWWAIIIENLVHPDKFKAEKSK